MSKKMKQPESDINNPIPYKYIDADNKVYKDPYLNNNNSEDSEEINAKKSIESKSKTSKKRVKLSKDLLSEEEINELIEEKNSDIIDLNKKAQKLKNALTSLVKKLNEKITANAEILYKKEITSNEIQWLTEQLESKNKTLQIEKKINNK